MEKRWFRFIAVLMCLIALVPASVFAAGTAASDSSTPPASYTDVTPGAWYAQAVQYVSDNELMYGTGNGKFSPNAPLDRAMLVTILSRHAKIPAVSDPSSFTDVPTGMWYSDAIAWAQECGIVAGTTPTTFSPFQPVTREQMAAIFFRYAAWSGIDTRARASLGLFTDANQVSNYAKDAISWCVAKGILSGSNGNLHPRDSATRAEFASILMRYIRYVVNGETPPPLPVQMSDLDPVGLGNHFYPLQERVSDSFGNFYGPENCYMAYATSSVVDAIVRVPLQGRYRTLSLTLATYGRSFPKFGNLTITTDTGKVLYDEEFYLSKQPQRLELDVSGAQSVTFRAHSLNYDGVWIILANPVFTP